MAFKPAEPVSPTGPALTWATAQLEVTVVRATEPGADASQSDLNRALEAALAIEDERRRAEALVALLPRLSQADRERAIAPIVQAATALQARGADAENVAGLGPESREGRLRAIEDYDAALALFRAAGNQEGEIRTLASLGAAYSTLNEHEMATGYYEDVLKLHRARGDRTAIAITLSHLAAMYESLGQWESALDYYTEALPLWQEAGDRGGEAAVLNGMGSIYVAVGGARRALEYYEQALPLLREADNRTGEAITLDNIGGVYADMGEPRRAVEYFEQALKLRQQVGDPSGETATLGNLGAAYATLGEQQRARDCFERALKAAEAIEGDQARAEALVALVPHLSGRQRERAVALALAAAERIRDPDRRMQVLAALNLVRSVSSEDAREQTPKRARETTKTTHESFNFTSALKLACVPTAIIQLLDPERYPLAQVELTNTESNSLRLRITCRVQEYSDTSIETLELAPMGSTSESRIVLLSPVFRREMVRRVTELTPASLLIQVEDIEVDAGLLDETRQISLLPVNAAPIRIKDEVTGALRDMLPYLGAFVTENEPSIRAYLKTVAGYHPSGRLEGYYADPTGDATRSQMRALFDALKHDGKLSYATAQVIRATDYEYQRARLPRECLEDGLANSLEGVLLCCSLLEAMGLQSAIVWIWEHAAVAWKEYPAAQEWSFLDTTRVMSSTFEQAMEWGTVLVEEGKDKGPESFRILPIRDLRVQGITPLE